MKTVLATVITLFLLAGAAFSQTTTQKCVQNDPNAVLIGSMSTTVSFQSPAPYTDTYKDSVKYDSASTGTGGDSYGTKPKNTGDVIIDVYIWRIGGQTTYSLDASSIRFTGDGAAVDSMKTMDLFNLLAQVIIGQGMSGGYSQCSGSCTNNLVKVNFPACVARTGTGTNTRFDSCDPRSCCTRTYSICCSDGTSAPFIRLVGSSGSSCSGSGPSGGACEPTCP